jgi:hypothetical protein
MPAIHSRNWCNEFSVARMQALILVGLFLVAQETLAAVIVHSDSEFADSNWNISVEGMYWSTGTNASTQAQDSGSHGAYRLIEANIWAGLFQSSNIYFYHTNTAFTYDPSSSGAITSLDIAFDRLWIQGGMDFLPYLIQNNTRYMADTAYRVFVDTWSGSGWINHAFTGLTANDFGGIGSRPDFSEQGAPISFGFVAHGGVGSGALASKVGFDDWTITVTNNAPSVPSPGGIWLLCAGLFGMLAGAVTEKRNTQGSDIP